MIRGGARRLILLGRTALPARSAWSNIDVNSRAGRRVVAVRALESMGASIHRRQWTCPTSSIEIVPRHISGTGGRPSRSLARAGIIQYESMGGTTPPHARGHASEGRGCVSPPPLLRARTHALSSFLSLGTLILR